MPTLPANLGLTNIADGASIVAADHRNNYNSIQTALNALIAILAGGANGQVLGSQGGSTVGWQADPLTGYLAYTPTWASSGVAPAYGNATITARYLQFGKMVHAYGIISFGSTTTFGTGNYTFSPPVAVTGNMSRSLGMYDLFKNSNGFRAQGMGEAVTTTTMEIVMLNTLLGTGGATVVGQTAPWTWASGDFIGWNMTYEAA